MVAYSQMYTMHSMDQVSPNSCTAIFHILHTMSRTRFFPTVIKVDPTNVKPIKKIK